MRAKSQSSLYSLTAQYGTNALFSNYLTMHLAQNIWTGSRCCRQCFVVLCFPEAISCVEEVPFSIFCCCLYRRSQKATLDYGPSKGSSDLQTFVCCAALKHRQTTAPERKVEGADGRQAEHRGKTHQKGLQGPWVCWPERGRMCYEIWNSVTTNPVSNSKRKTRDRWMKNPIISLCCQLPC